MKLRPEQLSQQLQQQLLPVYLVSGDEPLLVQEASDAICQRAQQQGFCETLSYRNDQNFSWDDLIGIAQSGSLFSQQQLIKLHLSSDKIGTAGSQALQDYVAHYPNDKILLIIAPKIESSTQKSKWYTAIDKCGGIVTLWPIGYAQLPAWLRQRLAQHKLRSDAQGLQLLAQLTEGNLLAAAQEIEKLALLYGEGSITAEDIANAVSDNAHFSIFALQDAVLAGDSKRCQHILQHLQGAGEAATLVLWVLVRCIRQLTQLSADLSAGIDLQKSFQQLRIWRTQQSLYSRALKHHPLQHWQQLLSQAARIDGQCKGAFPGDPWAALLSLSLAINGQTLCGLDDHL